MPPVAPLATIHAIGRFCERCIPIGVLAALIVMLFCLGGCNQAQRDAQADRVDQVGDVLEQVLEQLTAENVDRALGLVVQFAPVIGRDDLAARAQALQDSGEADAKLAEARQLLGALGTGLDEVAADLREPDRPTWLVVLGTISTVATAVAGVAGVKGQAAARALRGVVSGVEGLTEAGVLPKDARKTAMKRTLTAKDEELVRRLKADGSFELKAKKAGLAVIDAQIDADRAKAAG